MDTAKKPNDILVATLTSPQSSTLDLLRNNFNCDNTSLLSKEEYKNTPLIKKTFTKDGVFDEDSFNKLYNLAEQKYFELDDELLYKNLEDYLEYGITSRYRPLNGKKRDMAAKPETIKNNPLLQSFSLIGLNEKSDPKLTPEEVAQTNKIWDPVNKKWLDESAESRSLIDKFFGDTLIYALYDKDGVQTNPVTGEIGSHHKGEFITDENGNYFTEILGDRELLDKQVVSTWDTLTEEGSFANSLDFMDSDGYDKSIGGIAMKTFVSILPYCVPGFNKIYGATTAMIGLMSALPTFYKSAESLITGEESSELSKSATKMENWFRKLDTGTSYEGRNGLFTIEGVGNMIADTFGLLYQQRAAASLSKLFYKIPKEIKTPQDFKAYKEIADKMNNLSKNLTLGYMGLISAADVYNDALNAGYDKRTAGITSLLSASALYGIMNFNESTRGLGTWFLDKTTGFDHEMTRLPIIKVAKSMYDEFEAAVQKGLQGDKAPLGKAVRGFKNNVLNWVDNTFRASGEDIWKGFIVEGVEETSEEVVQDTVKGIIDTLSWLGFTQKEGSFGGWNNVFSAEGASRYLQTALGGAFGGALFGAQRKFEEKMHNWRHPEDKVSYTKQNDLDIFDIVYEGRTEELISELEHCKKLFSNKRAATGYLDENGEYHDLKADGQTTQADMIISAAIDKVRAIDTFTKELLDHTNTNIDLMKDDLFKEIAKDYFKSSIKEIRVEDYLKTKFEVDLADAYEKYKIYKGNTQVTEEKPESTELVVEEADKEAEKKQKATKKQNIAGSKADFLNQVEKVRGFFNGQRYVEAFQEAQLLTSPEFARALAVLDEQSYYENVLRDENNNIAYKDLAEDDPVNPYILTKKKVKEKWELYKNTKSTDMRDMVRTLPLLRESLMKIGKIVGLDFNSWVNFAHKDAIIKSLKNSRFNTETIEKLVANLNDDELFDEEELEGLEAKKEEDKNVLREKRKKLINSYLNGTATQAELWQALINPKVQEIAEEFRSKNLVEILSKHPKAWSLQDRISLDLASKIIDSGVITLNDKIKNNSDLTDLVKEVINKLIYSHNLSEINKDFLELLPIKINELLNGNGVFAQRYREVQQQENEGSDSLIDTSVDIANLVTFNSSVYTDKMQDITKIKLNSILDYIGNDEYISEGLFKTLLQYYKGQTREFLTDIKSVLGSWMSEAGSTYIKLLLTQIQDSKNSIVKEGDSFRELFKRIINSSFDLPNESSTFRTDYFDELPISDTTSITEEQEAIIEEIAKKFDQIQKFYKDHGIKESSDFVADFLANPTKNNCLAIIDKIISEINNFVQQTLVEPSDKLIERFNNKLVTNPFITGLNKLHYNLTGNTNSSSIFEYALNKALNIADNNFKADEVSFTNEEISNIRLALQTLSVALAVAHAGLKHNYDEDHLYGFNQLTIDYVKVLNKGNQIEKDLLFMDPEDYHYLETTVMNMQQALADLLQVNSELFSDKIERFQVEKLNILKSKANFYKYHIEKLVWKIGSTEFPILDKKDIPSLPDSDNYQDYEEFIAQCDLKIAENLNELRKNPEVIAEWKASTDKTIELVIIDGIFNINLFKDAKGNISPSVFNSGASLSSIFDETINENDYGKGVDALYFMNLFTGMLSVTPKQVNDIVTQVLEENPTFYPKADQIEALKSIIYFTKGVKNYNYLASKLSAAYNENPDTFFKTQLQHTLLLFGEGGSGKTLLTSLLRKVYGKELYALAKSDTKVAELAKALETAEDHTRTLDHLFSGEEAKFKAYSDAFVAARSSAVSFFYKNYDFNEHKWKDSISYPDNITVVDGNKIHVLVKNGDTELFAFDYYLENKSGNIEEISSNNRIVFTTDVNEFLKNCNWEIKPNAALVIDECTLLNNFEWWILSNYAALNDSFIIGLGDPTQCSDSILYLDNKGQEDEISIGAENYFATYTQLLKGCFRAESTGTRDNSSGLHLKINELINENIENSNNTNESVKTTWDKLVSNLDLARLPKLLETKFADFKFKYITNLEGDRSFLGTILTRNVEEIKRILESIAKAPGSTRGKKIGVIVNDDANIEDVKDELSSKYGFKKDDLDVKTFNNILGAEYDYTIAYKLKAGTDAEIALHKCYTEITRNRYGNLIIQADENDLFDFVSLNKCEYSESIRLEVAPKVEEFNTEYKDFLKLLSAKLKDFEITKVLDDTTPPLESDEDTEFTEEPTGGSVDVDTEINEEESGEIEEVETEDDKESSDDAEIPEKNTTLGDKVSDNLEKSGFDNFCILQSWYFHPGVGRETIDKIRHDNKKLSDWMLEPELKDSELESFYNLVMSKKYPTDPALSTLVAILKSAYNNISGLGVKSTNKDINALFILDYKAFIRNLRLIANTKQIGLYELSIRPYDTIKDTPLDKQNDGDPKRSNLLTFGVLVSSDTTKYSFTLGSLGYTARSDGSGIQSAVIRKLYTDYKKGRRAPITRVFSMSTAANPKATTYLNNIGRVAGSFTDNQNGAVIQMTGNRNMRLEMEDVKGQNNANLFKSLDESLFTLGRIHLQTLLNLGYTILTLDTADVWNPKSIANPAARKAAFINWYNKYRFSPLDTTFQPNSSIFANEEVERLSLFSDNTWIVVLPQGSNLKIPLNLRKTIPSIELYIMSDQEGKYHIFSKGGKEGTAEKRRLTLFNHKRLIWGLCKIAGISTKTTPLPSVIKCTKFDLAAKKFEWDKSAEDDVNAFRDLILNSSTTRSLKKAIDLLFKSYINALKRRSLYDTFFSGKPSEDEKIAFFKSPGLATLNNPVDNITYNDYKDSKGKKSHHKEITSFLKFLDKEIPGYFYETDPLLTNLDNFKWVNTSAMSDLVVEIAYEDANYVLDFDMLVPVTSGTGSTGSTEGSGTSSSSSSSSTGGLGSPGGLGGPGPLKSVTDFALKLDTTEITDILKNNLGIDLEYFKEKKGDPFEYLRCLLGYEYFKEDFPQNGIKNSILGKLIEDINKRTEVLNFLKQLTTQINKYDKDTVQETVKNIITNFNQSLIFVSEVASNGMADDLSSYSSFFTITEGTHSYFQSLNYSSIDIEHHINPLIEQISKEILDTSANVFSC